MDQPQDFSELFKNLMPRAKFAHKYGFVYYKVTEAIAKGSIATHCIDGRIYINVPEALSVLRPSVEGKRQPKVIHDDLFA